MLCPLGPGLLHPCAPCCPSPYPPSTRRTPAAPLICCSMCYLLACSPLALCCPSSATDPSMPPLLHRLPAALWPCAAHHPREGHPGSRGTRQRQPPGAAGRQCSQPSCKGLVGCKAVMEGRPRGTPSAWRCRCEACAGLERCGCALCCLPCVCVLLAPLCAANPAVGCSPAVSRVWSDGHSPP